MASYLNVTFNHFLAVQRWATVVGAHASLDMKDFRLEVKHRGRYYMMHPMFQGHVNGRLVHLSSLTEDVRGFGGWRPYPTITHPCSTDKLLFKRFLRDAGFRTPASWQGTGQTPPIDYLLKAQTGSFGDGLAGPYRGGIARPSDGSSDTSDAAVFAEQFVQGEILKVWFWGRRPFFAHMHPYPGIVGNGQCTAEDLLRAKVQAASMKWDSFKELPVARDCLAFQGVDLAAVVPEGQSLWIDYRYGHRYPTSFGGTPKTDDQLEDLRRRTGNQLAEMGAALAELLRQTMPAPVVISVDGMLDDNENIWWLEMNTNSLMPPEGYTAMFEDLFA